METIHYQLIFGECMAEFIRFDFPIPNDEKVHKIWNDISTLRHDVYAEELQQYYTNDEGKLEDPGKHFVVCLEDDEFVGYVSLNPPNKQPFRLTKYFSTEMLHKTVFASCYDLESTFEVRGLTVSQKYRGQNYSTSLMRHALEFVVEHGGTDIVAMGHSDVTNMYARNGMKIFEEIGVQHGKIVYYPMHLNVSKTLTQFAAKIQENKDIETSEDTCYHGGQSWETSGFDFNIRDSLIVADVLDSPFPPCPEVLQVIKSQLARCCQESPPTQCEELIETIAEIRDIPSRNVAVSSGSSSLMFSLLPQLLNRNSSVMILSPMYGEYSHILHHVIGCSVTYFVLEDDNGFKINPQDLISQAIEHDAVIFVNPNSPTGVYCEEMSDIVQKIAKSKNSKSNCKMIWVDETYINYLPDAESLERLCSSVPELIICKSMSKCYALSGLRVAYAVTQEMPKLKKFIPPWAVSLPGQLAAVAALHNEPYYLNQYEIIHKEREKMHTSLESLGFRVFTGVANYLLTYLPEKSGFSSSQFIETCKSHGLFVRDAQNMGLELPSSAVRFAVRSPIENKAMLEIIGSVINSNNNP